MAKKIGKVIAVMLWEQFEQEWQKIVEQYRQAVKNLEESLAELRESFGEEAVQSMVELSGFNFVVSGSTDSKKKKIINRSKRKRRRQSSSRSHRSQADCLSFRDIKGAVLEAVTELVGRQFCRRDVDEILDRQGVKFNPGHVSLVLSNHLKGLRKLGKTPRKDNGGTPFNLYEVADRGKLELV